MSAGVAALGTPEVTLSGEQCWTAAQIGLMRHLFNLQRGDAHGFNGDGWEADIEGAGAEYAFALALDRTWTPLVVSSEFSLTLDGDVEDVEIRSTTRHGGGLILHESDPDDRPFVLVTGKMPRYVIRGWRRAHYGKKPEYWVTPPRMRRACFLVPQGELHPVPDRRRAAA